MAVNCSIGWNFNKNGYAMTQAGKNRLQVSTRWIRRGWRLRPQMGALSMICRLLIALGCAALLARDPSQAVADMRASDIEIQVDAPAEQAPRLDALARDMIAAVLDSINLLAPQWQGYIHDLNGQLRVSPTAMTLENCRGFVGEGPFTVTAAVALDNFKPTTFTGSIDADALPIDVPDTLEMLIRTHIDLKGTPEQVNVTGEVVLLDGLYYKHMDIGLLSIAGKAGRKTRKNPPAPASGGNGMLDRLALDVAIKHRHPLVIDNNLALLSLKPSLRLYGTAAAPLVSGRAAIDSGAIMFEEKEFEITRGVIDYINPHKIEPTIDLTAALELREWIISLGVSGVPNDLQLSLRSEPPEEHGDILSLLAFGKTMPELTGGEGDATSAKQILADLLADSMSSSLKDATGLDTIELKYTEGNGKDSQDSIDVTVGKELSRQISVKYGVETMDGETVQKVTTEYKFLENLLMNAFQNTRGNYGGELQYRLEFQ